MRLRANVPAPRSLSRAAIVDAALKVLDREGLDALTMRRVAEELGTGPASLYAHVDHKDDLVAAVFDRVSGDIELPGTPDPARWQEQITELALGAIATFRQHRDLARAALGTIPTGDGSLSLMEAMVSILLAGGVDEQVTAWSLDLLAFYITATAYEYSVETDAADTPHGAELVSQTTPDTELRAWFSSLPDDRYPHLVAMAGALTSGDGEQRTRFHLDVLVRGIASTVPARRRRRR